MNSLRRSASAEYTLLFLYFLTRLHALTALPGFFDEAVHVRWAKLVWALQPFHAASDGRLLNIWAYAALFPFGGALWIARAATVLLGVLGFAAMLALGSRLFSRRAALAAGLVYLTLPYAFFYERMALADPFAAPFVPLMLLAVTIASHKRGAALTAGAALAALVLTKLTNLLFVPLPLLAWLLLARRRPALRNALITYATAGIILALAVVVLKGVGHSDLGFDLITARTGPVQSLAARLESNLGSLAGYAAAYGPWPALGLLGLGLISAAGRERGGVLLLAATVALPAGAMLIGSNVAESRFLVPALPAAALLAGRGADWALGALFRLPQRWSTAALAGLALLLAGASARFGGLAWRAPGELPLIAWDRYQYVEEWPAGFGLRDTAALIFGPGAERPLDVVLSDEGHIPQLSLYAPPEPSLSNLYTYNDNGVRLLHLPRNQHNPYAGLADPARPALYVVEVPRFQAERDALQAELTLVASFTRPGGRSVIEVYRLVKRET